MSEYKRLNKGAAWEYRVHRAQFASGWYVRRGIDLRERIEGAPQVMAEVDLLGLSYDAGLNLRRFIAECKDRKGSGQEADRVIWLLGLGQLLGSDELALAKPRIAPATVRFARTTNVALIDEARVAHAEGQLQGPRTAGSFDADIGEDLIKPAVARPGLGDNRLRDAWDWIHNASWTEEPLPRVKRLPGYFRLVMQHAKGKTRELLLIEGLLGLLACSLQVSGLLRRHSPSVARALGTEVLASGAAPANALIEIAAAADDYYRDAFIRDSERQFGERMTISVARLAGHIANPPKWAEAFFAMAESLGSRPEQATDILRYADLALIERFAGRDPQPALAAFIRGDHTWLAGSLALAKRFCARVWSLDDPFFAGNDGSPPPAANVAPDTKTEISPEVAGEAASDGTKVQDGEMERAENKGAEMDGATNGHAETEDALSKAEPLNDPQKSLLDN
jgi:hypothetical protein